MTSPLIASYLTGLRHELPGPLADEAADGLVESYELRRAAGAGDQDAARDALADFGDLALVVAEYTQQAPGRHCARLLLATGPVAAASWAAALITSHAWAWPVPAAGRIGFAAFLLLTVLVLIAAATSRRSYRRTRLALVAGPAIIALDATAVAVTLAAAPAINVLLLIAAAVSLGRIAIIAPTLRRTAAR